MKISTLRILDIWIGRPVCWVITVLHLCKRLFVKKTLPPPNPKKILFVKLFGAGSVVLAYPTIKATKERFPDAQINFLTFHGNQEILPLTGIIRPEDVYTVKEDTFAHLLADIAHCLKILRAKKFDVVIDLEFFSRFTAILSFVLRSDFRIGFYGFYTEGLRRGRFIHPVHYNHTLHTARAFFTLLKPLGIDQQAFDPTLPIIPASSGFKEMILERAEAAGAAQVFKKHQRWVVINSNTSELIALRQWPGEHYVELVCLLFEALAGLGIIFIGKMGERAFVDSLIGRLKQRGYADRAINLAGLTSIADLLDVFHLAELFITNDSGPSHLAALTRVPTIAIFGPETPDLYAPLNENCRCLSLGLDCQPCVSVYNGKHSYCLDNQCLKQLKAERVFNLAMQVINKQWAGPSPHAVESNWLPC